MYDGAYDKLCTIQVLRDLLNWNSSKREEVWYGHGFSKGVLNSCRNAYSSYVIKSGKEVPRYKELNQQFLDLLKQMEEKLGEDKSLVFLLEETANERFGMEEDWIYQQGMRDACELLEWLGLLKR